MEEPTQTDPVKQTYKYTDSPPEPVIRRSSNFYTVLVTVQSRHIVFCPAPIQRSETAYREQFRAHLHFTDSKPFQNSKDIFRRVFPILYDDPARSLADGNPDESRIPFSDYKGPTLWDIRRKACAAAEPVRALCTLSRLFTYSE